VLPYLQLQGAYVLASAGLVAALDRTLARRGRLGGKPRRLAAAVAAALGLPLALAMLAIRAFDHPASSYQFLAVALGFYAATIWIPLAALARAARRPRDPALAGFSLAAIPGGQ
jgi:hypothetical protein